jgi:hypothetical protein
MHQKPHPISLFLSWVMKRKWVPTEFTSRTNPTILLKIPKKVRGGRGEERKLLTGACMSLFLLNRVYTGSQGQRLESFCARPESSLLISSTSFFLNFFLTFFF